MQTFGEPDIDLFASRLNCQCERYVSWMPDPGAFAVDAFSLNWSGFKMYAFPPFSLISRVLQQLLRDSASGILIVPDWPTQSWYPLLMRYLRDPPLSLSHPNLLQLPFAPERQHPLQGRLRLLACHI